MKRGWWYRFTFLILVGVLSAMMVTPTAFKFSEDSSFPVKSKINLGLDLQGGLYMILGIDFKKVYKDEIVGYGRKIEFLLNDNGINAKIGSLNDNDKNDPRHSVVISDSSKIEEAKEKVREFFGTLIRLTSEENGSL